MKLSALLLTSGFALLVVSTPLGPECLALEASGLIETIAGTLCGKRCTGADGQCDSSCPYCSCGYCKSTEPPKLRRSEIDEAPALEKKGAMLTCGSPCTSNADCVGCTNWCQTSQTGGYKAEEVCFGKCGSDADCPACSPYCWPTRVGGSCRDAPPPSKLKKKAEEVCFGHCGSDADCPACSPYCWPTRVGGSCRDAPHPKLNKKAEEGVSKKDNIPAIFKKEEAAACGGKCTTASDCAYPCGNCHGGYCAGRIKAAREEASPLLKKDNCGAACSTQADCDCGRCIGGKCGYGP